MAFLDRIRELAGLGSFQFRSSEDRIQEIMFKFLNEKAERFHTAKDVLDFLALLGHQNFPLPSSDLLYHLLEQYYKQKVEEDLQLFGEERSEIFRTHERDQRSLQRHLRQLEVSELRHQQEYDRWKQSGHRFIAEAFRSLRRK